MAKKPDFLSDSPITDEEQDSLRRIDFVRSLYKEIVLLPSGDSFCFGIYGGWGEGKSSILNLLRNLLEKNTSIILFEFDPWYLSTKEVVLKNFLEGLERVLRQQRFFPRNFGKDLRKYFKKLSLGVTVLGTGGHIGFEFEKEGLLDLKRRINNQLEKSEKKSVILIDDIDRLEPDEVLLVFKLVKLIANFRNTVFVLSFDVKAVESSLKTKNISLGYIEKIIQKPIPLPKIEQPYIDSFLQHGLNSIFENLRIDKKEIKTFEREFFPIYTHYSNKSFTTLRSVKRYLSSIYSSLSPVVTETNLRDFLLLEMIKVFSPKLYDDIYENWFLYVSQRTELEISPPDFTATVGAGIGKKEEFKNRIKDHLNELLADEPKRETFINLLASLFPLVNDAFNVYGTFDTSKARQEKRIDSTSFLKYFTFRPPPKERSDYYIQEMIKSWNECDVKRLPELLDKTFPGVDLELLNKLNIFRAEISPSVAPALIKVISQNSKTFSREASGSYGELSMAENLEDLVVNLIKEKLDKSNMLPVLEDIMSCSDSLDFASVIYLRCRQSNKHRPDEKWNVLESIRQTLVNRFQESFVKPQKDFFLSAEPANVLFRLWDLSSEVEGVSPGKCSISKYVWWMLNNNPRYIGRIINSFISKPTNAKESSITDLRPSKNDLNKLNRYFDFDQFYKIAQTIDLTKYESEKEKEAVELFRKRFKDLKELTDSELLDIITEVKSKFS